MVRLIMRGVGILIFGFLLVSASYSKSPAKNGDKDPNNSDDVASANPSPDVTSVPDPAKAD